MSIGERISKLRTEQNLTQLQLAQILDISRQAVSKWENDQTSPDTIRLIQLADVLKTDVEYLATGNHSTIKSPPTVVTVTEKVEHIIEKPVVVDKIVEVEVEKIIEKVIEKPTIKKITRVKYVRNPIEFFLAAFLGLLLGVVLGLLF